MRKSTDIQKSHTKLDATAIITKLPTDLITLDQLQTIENFQRVTVKIKVISVKYEEVKKGLLKQDCVVGDATGTAKITVWEDNVGLFTVDESYKLSGAMVQSLKGNKYLSIPKYDFTVEPIDDIGTVNISTETDEIRILEDVEVRGVKFFDSYKGCHTCKGKVTPTTEKVGKCNRCNSIQRLDKCYDQVTAKLELGNDTEFKVLSSFSQSLRKYLDLMMQPSKHCSLVNHFMLNIPQQESSPRFPDSYADTNSYADISSFTAIAI